MVDTDKNGYNGTNVLEILQDAMNYNNHLISTIYRYLKDFSSIVDLGAGLKINNNM